MKRKNKNRLTKLIMMELVCLGIVSVAVFTLVRWSGGRVEGNEGDAAGGRQLTITAAPDPGINQSDNESENKDGEKENLEPTIGSTVPTKEDEEGVTGTPVPSITDIPAGTSAEQVTDAPTKTPEKEENKPTPTKQPEATPTKEPATPTPQPTKAPEATPTKEPTKAPEPTPTKEPTKVPEPTKAPEPTKTPEQSGIEEKPGMDMDFINSLSEPQSGEILEAAGAVRTVFYLQTDSRWGNKIYGGEDTIAKYGCGPTSMAIVVSSLTKIGIDPEQMSKWAKDKGYWYPKSGSIHSIVNGTAKAFGLESEGIGNDSSTPEKIKKALKNGDMVVALMGKGHFTKGGHFIVLRGITDSGKILVADCNSRDNTLAEWDLKTLTDEAKWASDGGPFWIIRNPNTIK